MIRRSFAALSAGLTLMALTGCASLHTMPFANATEKLEDKQTAIYLLMVTMENQYRSYDQPTFLGVIVDRRVGDQWERESHTMDMNGVVVVPGAPVNSYAARLALAPGEYRLRTLYGNSYSPLGNTHFYAPLYAPLSVRESRGVAYLGNVRATLRQAKAGAPAPTQEAASFDVVITDGWRTDEAAFRNQFPVLAKAPIRKAVLPPYDRARVAREVARDPGK
ncbi:hypothetical protein FVQ98_07480 [Ottowia sp. GY511]|uniref:DUF2846 domain-containing protein n=1 Tax=Ottowia flava TaxID=2675430 RepID=A0ABW4KQ91_9BURK|nr:hypothetical protein [Ottowia sp. GY511]TXK29725.1 hypothetical protein FVQ98_07480 [Ottowia sp. GY511]